MNPDEVSLYAKIKSGMEIPIFELEENKIFSFSDFHYMDFGIMYADGNISYFSQVQALGFVLSKSKANFYAKKLREKKVDYTYTYWANGYGNRGGKYGERKPQVLLSFDCLQLLEKVPDFKVLSDFSNTSSYEVVQLDGLKGELVSGAAMAPGGERSWRDSTGLEFRCKNALKMAKKVFSMVADTKGK